MPDGSYYSGEFLNGIPNGVGECIFPNGNLYAGEFHNGKPNGLGKYTFLDGCYHIGEFLDGKTKGLGKCIFSNGDCYVGEFHDGQPNGQGKYIFPDGSYYFGEFLNGIPNGVGECIFSKGNRYAGEFHNGKPNGLGKYTFPNGCCCVGEFLDGQLHGKGIIIQANGYGYIGDFINGKKHGQGECIFPNGTHYAGGFHNGIPNGQGKYTFPDGGYCFGEIHDWKLHGKGTIRQTNGYEYTGDLVNGKKHGQGKCIFSDGDCYVGKFHDGLPHGEGTLEINGLRGTGIFLNGIKNDDSYYAEFCNKLPHGHEPYIIPRCFNGKFTLESDNPPIFQETHFINHTAINLNKKNIKDPLFFYLLFGIHTNVGSYVGYSLGILSDYFGSYFKSFPEIQKEIVTPLREAAKLCSIPPDKMDQKANEILKILENKEPYIIPYGFKDHALLLYLNLTEDRKFIECEIYNSGNGLKDYHAFNEITKKYQLVKKYDIPIESLTPKKLCELLGYLKFSNVDQAYSAISEIEGTKHIIIPEKNQVWKKPQKSNNCELKRIFALLAQKFPRMYKSTQKDIVQNTLLAALQNPDGFKKQNILEFDRVQQKINKLALIPGNLRETCIKSTDD